MAFCGNQRRRVGDGCFGVRDLLRLQVADSAADCNEKQDGTGANSVAVRFFVRQRNTNTGQPRTKRRKNTPDLQDKPQHNIRGVEKHQQAGFHSRRKTGGIQRAARRG